MNFQKEPFNELEVLINDFVACARYSCSLLTTIYAGKETFLRAKVAKLIPNEGFIEEVYYSFHGGGCYFEYPTMHIDVDFGPENRCDGFDLFRLKDFLSSLPDKGKYSSLRENTQIEKQFEDLVKNGLIFNPEWTNRDYLFCLTNPKL